MGRILGKEAVERSITWNRNGTAWGFDSDKGMEAFAADARNLSVPVTKDWFKQGDADGELAKASNIIEAEYRCDYAYHAQMEPLNAVASVSPNGDSRRSMVRLAKSDDGNRGARQGARHFA